jgi:hypothetical protein
MNERHQLAAVEDHPAATCASGQNIGKMQFIGIVLVVECKKMVAVRILELSERASGSSGQSPDSGGVACLNCQTQANGEQRSADLLLRQGQKFRRIGEEVVSIPG